MNFEDITTESNKKATRFNMIANTGNSILQAYYVPNNQFVVTGQSKNWGKAMTGTTANQGFLTLVNSKSPSEKSYCGTNHP